MRKHYLLLLSALLTTPLVINQAMAHGNTCLLYTSDAADE